MKDRDPKKLKLDEQVPKARNTPESEQTHLTTIKMDPHSPIQGFLCLDEHQKLFQNLWQRERRT